MKIMAGLVDVVRSGHGTGVVSVACRVGGGGGEVPWGWGTRVLACSPVRE